MRKHETSRIFIRNRKGAKTQRFLWLRDRTYAGHNHGNLCVFAPLRFLFLNLPCHSKFGMTHVLPRYGWVPRLTTLDS